MAVCNELGAQGQQWPGWKEVRDAAWIERVEVTQLSVVNALTDDLDVGEAEAIALASELGADLVLMDEREGRSAAIRLGLDVAGTVGVLLNAKKQGLLAEVRTSLDDLRETAGFYLNLS